MDMGVDTTSAVHATFDRLVSRAARIAYLLTGDRGLAERLAVKSFVRALGTWQHLRGGDALEVSVLKGVINGARRRWMLPRRPGDGSVDDLRLRFIGLRPRQKIALVLKLYESMEDHTAADLLQCSTRTLDSLLTSALGRLAAGTKTSEPERMVGLALDRWAQEPTLRPVLTARTRRSVWIRRLAASLGVLVLLPLAGVGIYAGAKSLVAVSKADDLAGDDPPGLASLPTEDGSSAGTNREAKFLAACPLRRVALPINDTANEEAASVALAFNDALVARDLGRAGQLAAPGSIHGWGHTDDSKKVGVIASTPGISDERVIEICGRAVAERSWKVVLHDSNATGTSFATFYLARLKDEGWKVWGSYTPPG